jgi:hypothetical protein
VAHLDGQPSTYPLDGGLAGFDEQLPGVAAHGEPQEIEPLIQVHDGGLVFVEDQTPRCQPCGQPCLDLPRLFLAVTQRDQVVGVSDHHGGPRFGVSRLRAGVAVADSGGLFQPVQRDIQQQRTDRPALGSSLLGWRESFARLENSGLEPVSDHVPGGERPELSEKVGMINFVEGIPDTLRASMNWRPRCGPMPKGCIACRPLLGC